VFFAAAQNEVISQRQALDWLLAENCWWLWSIETQRESLCLLVYLAPKLDASEKAELEEAIMKGPPREMLEDDIKPEDRLWLIDRKMWLRLSKLEATKAGLGENSKTKLDELTQQYPDWALADDDSDEFPVWMTTGDTQHKFIPTPRHRRELVEWLKKHSKSDFREEDDWYQRCRDNFPATACALCALTKEDCWPVDRWREALQAWSESQHLKQSWRYIGPVLSNAPDQFISSSSLAHGLSGWLKAIAKTFEGKEENFLNLCRRVIEAGHQDEMGTQSPVQWAINHPIGHVTEALLHFWYRGALEDKQGLPEKLETFFTQLCDTKLEKFRPGRILLTAYAVDLFRVDYDWTLEHLLPLFDWRNSLIEARLAWEGFLRSPRLYWPLLSAIKGPFLETVKHYEELGDHAKQYSNVLTFVALDHGDYFTIKELGDATRQLPPKGLASAAQALTRMLESAGDQRGDYWNNRVSPYLRKIWPKSRDLITPEISKNLAHLCVTAGEMFPDAWKELQHWIEPVECTDYAVHSMNKTKICEQYPKESLAFLNAVVGEKGTWYINELQQCLDDIRQANPQLVDDAGFIRLAEQVKRGVT